MCEIEELRVALVRKGKESVPAATRWHDEIGDRSRVVKPAEFGTRGMARMRMVNPFLPPATSLFPMKASDRECSNGTRDRRFSFRERTSRPRLVSA